MITNERQYRIARSRLARLNGQVADAHALVTAGSLPAEWGVIAVAGLEGTKRQIEGEVDEYERLKAGGPGSVTVGSLRDIPDALIRGRVAAGLTQKELADRIGVKEQQIQRYEASSYAGASIDRILQIADILAVRVEESATEPNLTASEFASELGAVGLSKAFVFDRLLSPGLADELADVRPNETGVPVQRACSEVERILGWRPGDTARRDLLAGAGVRFKVAANTNLVQIGSYVAYARFLAEQVAVAADSTGEVLSIDEARASLLSRAETLTFNTLLSFVWNLGIPVLPLNDSGKFHGASWRFDGRNVIALKQRTHSVDRWMFDLLHELHHALGDPALASREVIEIESPSTASDAEYEEIAANSFATEILLRARAEDLRAEVIQEMGATAATFSRAVVTVAARSHVRTGALANHLAYKLGAEMGINLWPVIHPLEEIGDPWKVCRDEIVRRLDLDRLDSHARYVLNKALSSDV